ncbi:MAG TPA: T9SS type A sorting domain-containing protein, partial [Ignavibacteriaceae bacterium]|nr:T9SS type A sorting domain-containing protein [Ignavibacteriaceae bacterium]
VFVSNADMNKSSSNSNLRDIVLTKDKTGKFIDIIKDYDAISLFSNNSLIKNFRAAQSLISSLALADLKQDGENYIIFTADNKINALNQSGGTADNFPFSDPLGIGFTGTPLAADFEGDEKSEIIAYTKDGRIFGIDGGTGKIVNGFPVSAGSALAGTPILFNYQGKTSIAVIDTQNVLYVLTIGSVEGKFFWNEENGNHFNTSFADAADGSKIINEFFPSNRAYNYPNPVYNGETQIRYYVSEDSKINIKIFDLSGDFVAEMNSDARGGFDNETAWNVNDIQSGVYLARIEAKGLNGKTETNIIKIAVIK